MKFDKKEPRTLPNYFKKIVLVLAILSLAYVIFLSPSICIFEPLGEIN